MSAFTSLETLCTYLNLDLSQRQRLINLASFPLLLPTRLAKKIRKGTLDDPILRQFVPLTEELISHPSFSSDPVGDGASCQTPRLLKKYESRALVMASGSCAMNCRFCFRRAYPYERGLDFSKELELIQADSSIREIILSGGDPLSLSNSHFQKLIDALDGIAHLQRLRIHTRYPLADPHRLDPPFIDILRHMRLQGWFILHTNHPNELDEELFQALGRLPCPVLTQTVLLKGVNDNVETLKALFEQLVDHGMMPYYLHQLDRVTGTHHFEVLLEEGIALMQALQKQLSGYALPRYVREVAGVQHKVILV